MKIESFIRHFNLQRQVSSFGLLLVGLLFVVAPIVSAQRAQSTDHKADQNLKSSARVNPSTLAMELSIPLGTYPGRAGNSIPLVFNYSSKAWRMERFSFHRETTDMGIVGGIQRYRVTSTTDILPLYGERTTGGWTSSLLPPIILEEVELYNQHGELYSYDLPSFASPNTPSGEWECHYLDYGIFFDNRCASGVGRLLGIECCRNLDGGGSECVEDWADRTLYCFPPSGGGGPNPTPTPTPTPEPSPTPTPEPQYKRIVQRVRVQMPDGSSHEFRKNDKVYVCEASYPGEPTDNCNESKDGTYLSVDGSGMRLVRGETQPGTNEKRDVLYMPDGGRYLFPVAVATSSPQVTNIAEQYIDANGNKVTYDISQKRWTDTMGRSINDPLLNPLTYQNPREGIQSFQLPGLDNQPPRSYSLNWKKLANALENPNEQLQYAGTDTCQSLGDNPLSSSLFVGSTSTQTIGYGSYVVEYVDKQRICAAFRGATVVPIFNPIVLAEVNLPNGTKYELKYNKYGEITKIIYPTGGYERFRYETVASIGAALDPLYGQANRGVKEQWVSFDGVNETQHWKYDAGILSQTSTNDFKYYATTIAPDGTRSERILLHSQNSAFSLEDPRSGMAIEEKVYSANCQSTSMPVNSNCEPYLLRRTLTEWITAPPRNEGQPNVHPQARRDPRPSRTISIIFEQGQALAVLSENEYDSNTDQEYFAHLNVKRAKQYQYVPLDLNTARTGDFATIAALFTSDKLARISETDYLYNPDYKARNINGLATEQRVLKPDGTTIIAKSQIFYDEPTYAPISYGVTLPSWIDPGPNTKRGQVTTTRSYYDVANNLYIEAHAQTDQFGNGVKAWDAKGNLSQVEFSPSYNYAYPTRAISAIPDPTGQKGSSSAFETTTIYDFNTGLTLSVTDANGQTTSTEYNDPLLRPTRVIPPVGGSISETIYNDTVGALSVKVRTQIDGTNWAEATAYMDGLGRTYKAQVKDSQGDVFTETEYDVMGRVKRVTNPYRQGETKYWTLTNYDEAGRVKEVFSPTQDGQTAESKVTTEYGISTVSGFVGTYIIGTDQAGKKGRSITNALGQLIRVDETTGNNDLGDIASPNQPTFYTYNPQGQMVKVQQGSQYRYFLYDNLGRLLRVRQPEQDVNPDLNWNDPVTGNNNWTAAFTYDNNGNMLTATDAKGVVITNAYDNLNRVVTRSYTLPQTTDPKKITYATPNATYKYDGVGATIPFAKGKLTEVSNGISTTKFTAFDNLGRLLSSEQITDGQVYKSSYKYNLSGLVEQTYPSGRVVKQINDSTGHLMRVFGRAANRAEQTYVNEIKRAADGRISQLRTGNGLWESAKFNSRLQITELALGTSPTDTSLWKLNYEYGELDQNGNLVASKNNGNIAKQILSYQGLTNSFVQSFKYDSLDRLKEAKETTNGSQNWIQTFDYDRYGNRISFSQTVGAQQLAINNLTLPSVDPLTNRFTTNQGYTYDFNGNLIVDAQNRSFKFNGDNKQVEVRDASNNQIGQYFYDSDGRRVKKISASETTIFVYDGMGKLVEEYSTQQSPTPTTSYVVTDTLQSVRAVTNSQGEVVSRRDFMPFGEELYAGTPNRTEALKYSQSGEDNIRKRFTGYEKDTETGLDFAEARYYNNQHGRFTAVDPLLSSGKSTNPQTFNRYIYVLNSPLTLTDPSGLQASSSDATSFYDWLYEELGIIRINVFTFSGRYEWRMGSNGVVEERPAYDSTFDTNISIDRTLANLKDVGTGLKKTGLNLAYSIPNAPSENIAMFAPQANSSFRFLTGTSLSDRLRVADYETPNNFQEGVGMFTGDLLFAAVSQKAPSFAARGTIATAETSGTATMNFWLYRGRFPHLSVRVEQGGQRVSSQLLQNGEGMAVVTEADNITHLLATSNPIKLPNAQAAMQYQRNLIQTGTVGRYSSLTNNCVTHVCGVLRAGGLSRPRALFEGWRFWIKSRAQN